MAIYATGSDGIRRLVAGNSDGNIVRSNPNILDNAYFANPINQRGLTSYTSIGYTIDRWRAQNSCGFSLFEDGIQSTVSANGTSAGNVLLQYLASENCIHLRGKPVTMSVLINHTNSKRCKPLLQIIGGKQNGVGLSPNDSKQVSKGLYDFTTLLPDDFTSLAFWIYFGDMRLDSGGEISSVKAAKLEEGAVQTLAHKIGDQWVLNDPPPDPALELLKCQRYFLKTRISRVFCMPVNINGQCALIVPLKLPIAMRLNKPVIEAIEIVDWVHHPNGYYDQNIAIASTIVNGDGNVDKDGNIGLTLALQTPLQNYTDGEFCCIASLKITLSADL